MTFANTYQRLSDSWALCGAGTTVQDFRDRARNKARSGILWGPSMAADDDTIDDDDQEKTPSPGAPTKLERSKGTNSTKSSDSSPKAAAPPSTPEQGGPSPVKFPSWTSFPCYNDTTLTEEDGKQTAARPTRQRKSLMEYMDCGCTTSPFSPRNLDETSLRRSPSLGIRPMEGPGSGRSDAPANSTSGCSEETTSETAADRRRQRHAKKAQQSVVTPHDDIECTLEDVVAVTPPTAPPNEEKGNPSVTAPPKDTPLSHFTVNKHTAVDLERTISELTMRSSYGAATAKVQENRRMAYYAVGKHHRQSGRGGNRRCYFTGKLILSGAPFYAGGVQQGLRTLVVFCLPSSLGLPTDNAGTATDNISDVEGHSVPPSKRGSGKGSRGILSRTKVSRPTTSTPKHSDEISLSVGEELDPNWGLDSDYLLTVLPDPNSEMLDEMSRRYPEQFETLPVQVRIPTCWKLYVKFCFFSGLPVAEGELHYKVRDEVSEAFGENVILSHEVMEAVHGHDSAAILKLPNLETFRYLRKHYAQQSSKLPDDVFQRQAWEMVLAEV